MMMQTKIKLYDEARRKRTGITKRGFPKDTKGVGSEGETRWWGRKEREGRCCCRPVSNRRGPTKASAGKASGSRHWKKDTTKEAAFRAAESTEVRLLAWRPRNDQQPTPPRDMRTREIFRRGRRRGARPTSPCDHFALVRHEGCEKINKVPTWADHLRGHPTLCTPTKRRW